VAPGAGWVGWSVVRKLDWKADVISHGVLSAQIRASAAAAAAQLIQRWTSAAGDAVAPETIIS